MFCIGEKVRYCECDAVVLACQDDEVLIIIGDKCVKWVDRRLVDAPIAVA